MKIYKFENTHLINGNISTIWKYFSNPKNLSSITPPRMDFKIVFALPNNIYEGQLITYRVTPFPGYRTTWVTEITHIEKERMFMDEQRFGPYKLWHHEHKFSTQSDGVLMTDTIYYALPFGFLGQFAHKLFIKSQIKNIFTFRKAIIETITF